MRVAPKGTRYGPVSNRYYDRVYKGPIRELRLTHAAWEALREEGITTLDQLRTVANQLEKLPGIGPKTARHIREELALVTQLEERLSDLIAKLDVAERD